MFNSWLSVAEVGERTYKNVDHRSHPLLRLGLNIKETDSYETAAIASISTFTSGRKSPAT